MLPTVPRRCTAGLVAGPYQPLADDAPPGPSGPLPRDQHTHADTAAGAGWWVQLGAYRQRTGALDFQHHLADEQPMLAPMLTVVIDHGLNKLQVGPYPTREDARTAADRLRVSLHLVPTLVEKH